MAADPNPRTHFTTTEVARRLGLAVRSVQLMVNRGELQAWTTPGGHRRIARASLERWIAEHLGTGAPGRAAPASRRVPKAPPHATRVLLIEDSAHYQSLVAMLIRRQFPAIELHVESDGIAGLVKAGQLLPDILIIDIVLPGMDGATVVTKLRSHPAFEHCRLLVITSLDETQRAPYADALDGVPVVHKPHLVAELPGLIRACLPARRGGNGPLVSDSAPA